MGSWDCYCAICGGVLGHAQVSRKPRTARFRRRFPSSNQAERNEGLGSAKSSADKQSEDDGDAKSLGSYDEEHSYDPEIISESETEWARTLHVLGFNSEAPGIGKAFVSGSGVYSDYGGVEVEPGSDPNYPSDDFFSCYSDFDNQGNPVFPFHWCCYQLLSKTLTGTTEVSRIDKDVLYSIMQELSAGGAPRLDLDYGDPGPPVEQFWDSNHGEELFLCHPMAESALINHLVTLIAAGDLNFSPANIDFGPRVEHDPFTKLPYDLLYKISCLLPVKDLLNLGKVSWPAQSAFQNNTSFWKERVMAVMPWFFELHELMSDAEAFKELDFKKLVTWTDKMTTPKRGMTGPALGIANRRRIWGVCEQIADKYLPRCPQDDEFNSGSVEGMIRKHSACVHMPVVYFPVPNKKDLSVSYWVRSWPEIYTERKLLEIFWDATGSLAGLSLTQDGQRRLFGTDDASEGRSKNSIEFSKEDWIAGFILHLPVLSLTAVPQHTRNPSAAEDTTTTSVKGISILQNSGHQSHFGQTGNGFSKRPLLVTEGMTVVGIMGQIGPENQIISIGLVQSSRPEFDDYSFAKEVYVPHPPVAEKRLWDNDHSDILSSPIWAHPSLRLVGRELGDRQGQLSQDVHSDLVVHQALLWAKDKQELRSLRRLTGYVVVGGNVMGMEDGVHYERPVHDLCGIRADFVPGYTARRRLIGIEKESDESDWSEQHCVHFDVDGQGGEFVNEISYAMHQTPKAIKLRTNRNREVYWGEGNVNNWQVLQAPKGEVIVGIVMTFAVPSGWAYPAKIFSHMKLSSVAALTLPL